MKQKVVFPFGYGLSYTTFAYSDAKITDNGNKTWTATVSVKNTGKCAGKEVVQLYIGDDKASVVRPKAIPSLSGYIPASAERVRGIVILNRNTAAIPQTA